MDQENSVNILIVDDRLENLIAMEAVLSLPGYCLYRASSGKEAEALVHAHEFAVILLDVQMPGIDGFETAKLIRKSERSKATPIIFVTALHREECYMRQGYLAGAVDYLLKPFNVEVLRAKVAVFADLFQKSATIEEQRRLMLELENTKELLRLNQIEITDFIENGSLPLHWVNAEGIIVWANQAELDFLGYERDEYVGQAIAKFHVDQEVVANILARLDQNETLRNFEARLKCKDGSIKDVLINSNVYRDNGKFVHTRCFTRDITERKRGENALRESIRIRDEFLSIASHELKTPITSLRLMLQMTQRSVSSEQGVPLSPARLIKTLDTSIQQVDRLNRLVEGLLDVSKIQAGKLTFNFEDVELTELVVDVSERLSHEAKAAGCTVELNLVSPKIIGSWDRDRLEQVILNLLSNAIKYAPGKPIILTVSADHEAASVKIQDFGPGVSSDKLERIFEKFERAEAPRDVSGLGLGLFIVKKIVNAHQGSIRVESKVEHGTKFIFELPLNRVEQSARLPVNIEYGAARNRA